MREKSNPKLGWRKTCVRNQGKIELLTIRTALSRTRVQNRFPTIRGWNFAHKIASRQPADGISRTKSLPDNPRREFRVQNCFPTTRGGNFAHKIASRQLADGISRTKLLLWAIG